ncbi:MAG: diguanylate cyclase [Eubacteriales bacterium]|nr:diguanylate cyclase [Eubacteriales bacterium]
MRNIFRLGNPVYTYVLTALAVIAIALELVSWPEAPLIRQVVAVSILTVIVLQAMQTLALDRQVKALQLLSAGQTVKLTELAERDPDTSLYTDSALRTRLVLEIARSKRYRHPLSLVMLEICDLATFTRIHGRARTKQIIQDFAGLLNETLRTTDIIGHNGDARFTITMPDTERLQSLRATERIQEAIAQFNGIQGSELAINIGLSEYHGEIIESFILVTEARLEQAKKEGPHQIVSD